MLHLANSRWGVPYRSVNQVVTPHFRTREPFVSMSQANVGLIRRDLLQQAEARALLQTIPVADLVAMARQAAITFLNDTLPLDPESGTMQTPQQYVEQVSATTGMPFSNVRRNMAKVHGVLDKVEDVLAGLTRGSICRCWTRATARSTDRCSASSRAPMRWRVSCPATRRACIRCGRRRRC
jgi:hypothetical protein